MPFFGHKFTTFKCYKRKNLPFRPRTKIPESLDEPIKIKLGDQESMFVDGEWKPVSGTDVDMYKENEYLKDVSKQLKEENNLLRMKIEILIDMLTEESFKSDQRKDDTFARGDELVILKDTPSSTCFKHHAAVSTENENEFMIGA